MARRDAHDAAVDFADRALEVARILFLDDAHDAAVFAHDAAQAEGIGLFDGQNAELVVAGGLDQAAQRLFRGQRHVAVQHQGRRIFIQLRHGLHHGVTGSQLRLLQGGVDGSAAIERQLADHLQHRCAAVPVDHA